MDLGDWRADLPTHDFLGRRIVWHDEICVERDDDGEVHLWSSRSGTIRGVSRQDLVLDVGGNVYWSWPAQTHATERAGDMAATIRAEGDLADLIERAAPGVELLDVRRSSWWPAAVMGRDRRVRWVTAHANVFATRHGVLDD